MSEYELTFKAVVKVFQDLCWWSVICPSPSLWEILLTDITKAELFFYWDSPL